MYFLVVLMILLYRGWDFLLSTCTSTVLFILSETTIPLKVLRRGVFGVVDSFWSVIAFLLYFDILFASYGLQPGDLFPNLFKPCGRRKLGGGGLKSQVEQLERQLAVSLLQVGLAH